MLISLWARCRLFRPRQARSSFLPGTSTTYSMTMSRPRWIPSVFRNGTAAHTRLTRRSVKIAEIKDQQGKQCPICYNTAINHRVTTAGAEQKFAYKQVFVTQTVMWTI